MIWWLHGCCQVKGVQNYKMHVKAVEHNGHLEMHVKGVQNKGHLKMYVKGVQHKNHLQAPNERLVKPKRRDARKGKQPNQRNRPGVTQLGKVGQ